METSTHANHGTGCTPCGWRTVAMAIAFAGIGLSTASNEASAQTVRVVELSGMEFTPSTLKIGVGDTVQWVWVEGFHNVESGLVSAEGLGIPDGRFRSGDPTGAPGTTFDLTFDQAFLDAYPASDHVYLYYCVIHGGGGMIGTVTVATGGCILNGDCADGIVCTDDVCNAGVCEHHGNTAPCDDGDPCTGGDTCSAGACVGTPIAGCCRTASDCDDRNPCTYESCSAGNCVYADNNLPCDDDDPCTQADKCSAGACAGSHLSACCRSDADCDDLNPCTNDVCDAGDCGHAFSTAACDDGNPCTQNERCTNGRCKGTAILDCCRTVEDCPQVACAVIRCSENRCGATLLIDCRSCVEESDCENDNDCTDDRCVEGRCETLDNTLPCDDGNPCTTADICSTGVCEGTAVVGCCVADGDCDDADPCTTDACADNACIHAPVADCGQPAVENGEDEGAEAPVRRIGVCGLGSIVLSPWLLASLVALRASRRLRQACLAPHSSAGWRLEKLGRRRAGGRARG